MFRSRSALFLLALAASASPCCAFPVNDQPEADAGVSARAKVPGTPAWASQLGGYAKPDQVKDLSEEDRNDFIAIIKDSTWPRRHADYLRDAKNTEPDAFSALARDQQGLVFLEWLRQRAAAREFLAGMAGQPALADAQIALLQSNAKAGFYGPALTKRLLGADSPAVAKLTAFGDSISGTNAVGALNKAFDNTPDAKGLAVESKINDQLDMHNFQNPDKMPDELQQNYRVAHDMVMNPAAFRKSRPDWFKDATPDEIKAQDNLPNDIGHVYQTMDYLRQQGKLDIVWGDQKEMGNSMADTSLHVERGKNGQADWKIVVRVNSEYKGVDPVLLAPIYTHEFLHAYDFSLHVQRDGIEVAQIIADFQEEEMRAFITQSHVDSAYARQIQAAALKQPDDSGARTLYSSSLLTQELSRDKDTDKAAYEASIAKLAQNALRERGYASTGGGINSIQSMKAQYQDERRNLRAELVMRQDGDSGLEKEIASATAAKDYDYRAALVVQKSRPARQVTLIQNDLQRVDKILKSLDDEQKRGLALKADSGLKTGAVPPPTGGNP